MFDVTYWRKFTSSDPNPHWDNIKQDGRCKYCGEYVYEGTVGTYWHYWSIEKRDFLCTSIRDIDHPYHKENPNVELVNEFVVPIGASKAWDLLTDVDKIVHCMPGAEITGLDGDDYLGTIKIKVGPIASEFIGRASFLEKDKKKRRAIIKVKGSDTKGNGFASGLITATIKPKGRNSCIVRFETDVTLSGRMASFGRNVMADISNKLFGKFVACVESDLLGGGNG